MRRTFISMTWTPGVAMEDARLLIRQMEDIYDLLRGHFGPPGQFDPLPTVRVFGAWELPSDETTIGNVYRSVDWMLERSLADDGQHILATRYLDTIRHEPWQSSHPHFDLSITALPIEDDQGEKIQQNALGITRRGMVSLVSLHPLAEVRRVVLRRAALMQLYAHYIGQMFDAPCVGPSERLEEFGGEIYCTNQCAMRYLSSVDDALTYGVDQSSEGTIYCEACQYDIISQILSYHYGTN